MRLESYYTDFVRRLMASGLERNQIPSYVIPSVAYTQGLTNQKNFHLPTGQVKKQITCPVEKLACPDFFFQK